MKYDPKAIEALASIWRERHADQGPIGASTRTFYEDSYRFARDALDQLEAIGIEMVTQLEGENA